MNRFSSLHLLTSSLIACTLVWTGCSKSESQPVAKQKSAGATQAQQEKSSSSQKQSEPFSPDEISPQMASEMQSIKTLVSDVGSLMIEARNEELDLNFESAIEKWNQIDARVVKEYGKDSWQATNARLATKLAEKRADMDFDERRAMSEIELLDRSADQLAQSNDTIEALIKRSEVSSKARKLWADHPQVVATYLAKQSRSHQALGQYPEAEQLMKETLQLREQVMTKNHPEYAAELHALGILYQHLDRHAEAKKALADSLSICKSTWGEDSKAYATYLNDYGVLLSDMDSPEAKSAFEEALSVYRQVAGDTSFDYAHCIYNLASYELNQSEVKASLEHFEQAQEVFLTAKTEDHEMIQQCRIHLATIHLMNSEPEKAESLLKQVVESRKRVYGTNNPSYAKSLFQLGVAYGKQGKYELAEPALVEALELQKTFLSGQHPDVKRTSEVLAVVYQRTGRPADAEAIQSRLEMADQRPAGTVR